MVTMTTTTATISVESRLRGALWGFFAGDALASPSHWYYGGLSQIKMDYGVDGIVDYTKPTTKLRGSIMNKSDVNGGGRSRGSSFEVRGDEGRPSIIGDVINHGKLPYWHPTQSYHYHATLQSGENTLEASLSRLLLRTITTTTTTSQKNNNLPTAFRDAYISFMRTPHSHNDTYASTCHRMFFANMIHRGLEPEDCPDNDGHNVDTLDGLLLPTIISLATAAAAASKKSDDDSNGICDRGEMKKGRESAAQIAAVTRRSRVVERVCGIWSDVMFHALHDDETVDMVDVLNEAARDFGMRREVRVGGRDEMSACYLQQSFPPLLDMAAKYSTPPNDDIWLGLLANANVGGENVHRGALFGAFLGARAGVENLPNRLIDGLYHVEELKEEIDKFVAVVLGRR